jgi:Mrp family chromosome partitioning ATPase
VKQLLQREVFGYGMSRYAQLIEEIEGREQHLWRGVSSRLQLHESRKTASLQWAQQGAYELIEKLFHNRNSGHPPQLVGFTGESQNCGCTGIAIAVAEALSKRDWGAVGLVEANFYAPRFAALFGNRAERGLAAAQREDGAIESFGTWIDPKRLWVVRTGEAERPIALDPLACLKRFRELREQFKFLIVDLPPVRECEDVLTIGKMSDGLVLILDANRAKRANGVTAVQRLRDAEIPILGAVVNRL